jgi:hypothetical protein
LALAAVLVVGGCAGTSDATDAPGDSPEAGAPTEVPSGPAEPTQPSEPTLAPVTPEPATPVPEPSPAPSDPTDASAAPSTDIGAAAACAGTDDNREFFASIAAVVAWTVYCPVLPSGWFVDSGQYRLAGGGWLEIAYRGPDGARLVLLEGTACADVSCLPGGEDLGEASFGGREGRLVGLDGADLAIVAGPAEGATWVARGSGLERDAFAAIAADFATVGP